MAKKQLTEEQKQHYAAKLAKSALGRPGWLSPRDEETVRLARCWRLLVYHSGETLSVECTSVQAAWYTASIMSKASRVLAYAVVDTGRSCMVPLDRLCQLAGS